ncbi:SWPV1-300 [Shearwaterpox virus]|uniref:SWPV1-300 n=1 Tax=Shearwaterpox virus TaxID=1974596 RepID=A0A1V0S8G6_CNPV|nr:SWPV1-300 [Shearwaterpox virus]
MNTANKIPLFMKLKMLCERDIHNMKSIKLNSGYTIDIFLTSKDKILLITLVDNIDKDLDTSIFSIYGKRLKKLIELYRKKSFIIKSSLSVLERSNLAYLPIEIRYEILSKLYSNSLISICKCLKENDNIVFDVEENENNFDINEDYNKQDPCIIQIIENTDI